jgi:hypothetical protein
VNVDTLKARYPATGDLTLYYVNLTLFGANFLLACDRDLANEVARIESEQMANETSAIAKLNLVAD